MFNLAHLPAPPQQPPQVISSLSRHVLAAVPSLSAEHFPSFSSRKSPTDEVEKEVTSERGGGERVKLDAGRGRANAGQEEKGRGWKQRGSGGK